MSIEKIKIIDSVGQEYTLPKTFELRSSPSARRTEALSTAFVHGAKDVSDGKLCEKYIEITGRIWAESDAEFNQKWDALAEHIIKDNFRIQNRGRQMYVKKFVDIGFDEPSKTGYHYGEISIRFFVEDPLWYKPNATQKQTLVTSSPKLFQYDIDGKVETSPKIIIANNANNFNFTIKNITDSNRSFTIQDSGAASGTTIEVDCREGTVKRGETNRIAVFSGLFLRLLGGRTNEFEYTGANCQLTFQYFEAWL